MELFPGEVNKIFWGSVGNWPQINLRLFKKHNPDVRKSLWFFSLPTYHIFKEIEYFKNKFWIASTCHNLKS